MDGESRRRNEQSQQADGGSDLLRSVRGALASADDGERYQLLAALFSDLAAGHPDGRSHEPTEQVEALSKRLNSLTEEKASLRDECATTKADLDHRNTQLEAEQKRGAEFQTVIEEQRSRLDSLKKQVSDLEAHVVGKNAEIHKAQAEQDQLVLQAQRAELERDDHAKVDRLEESKRHASREAEALRSEIEQLRADKDAKIASLEEELAAARAGGAEEAEIPFDILWARLASAKPALVERHVEPTAQAAERLIDSFIELVRFVDDFDKLIRPFLSKYTKHHQPVKVPWEVYANREDSLKTIQQTLAPVGGKPVGVVKIRLRGLYAWTEAAMIACDAAIESVAAELQEFLHGAQGIGSDPNRTIKDFVRDDGHELFLQHLRELRGMRLADAFGRPRRG